jgi:hypothetical protein
MALVVMSHGGGRHGQVRNLRARTHDVVPGRLETPAREGVSDTLEIQSPQIGPELVRQVGARQCEFHGRLEESQLLQDPGVLDSVPDSTHVALR